MKIGIDISQVVYAGTGVAKYVRKLVTTLVESDKNNQYVLFGSSLRRKDALISFYQSLLCDKKRVTLRLWSMPPTLLDFLWNRIHTFPIEWFIGGVDVFWSSDWTQPPLGKTIGITTIHDVSFLRYPESFPASIRSVQKRRLKHAKMECSIFLCDSKATKQDCIELLGIAESKLDVVYPGIAT